MYKAHIQCRSVRVYRGGMPLDVLVHVLEIALLRPQIHIGLRTGKEEFDTSKKLSNIRNVL